MIKSAKFKVQSAKLIIDILQRGGVVAAPTDTVYGLLADATNSKAVQRVYKIKDRGVEKALPIFLYSLKRLNRYVEISKSQNAFLQQVWPGKVTAILKIKEAHPLAKNAVSNDGTCAFRIPNHPLILEILNNYKKPLTGTSANRSGIASCLTASCVRKQLKKIPPDLIIEGEPLPPSEPSTIIDISKTPWQVVRKGADYKKIKALLNSEL